MTDDQSRQRYHHFSRWERPKTHAVRIGPLDLDYLHKLFIHGPLSTAMLHRLVRGHARNPRTTARLRLLKGEPNLLVDQPQQQRLGHNANYSPLVYAINKRGIQVLKNFGRISDDEYRWFRARPVKHYHHDVMAAYITASIELGTVEAGVRFIPWTEILSHAKCPQATKDAKNPFEMKVGKSATIPDALFGIETPTQFTFYALEADRRTEPIVTHELKRSSYGGKLSLYREIMSRRLYRDHFGISSLMVLTVTVSDLHMKNIMAHLKVAAPSGLQPFLFKSVPELNMFINTPPNTGHMFTIPWSRVGDPHSMK